MCHEVLSTISFYAGRVVVVYGSLRAPTSCSILGRQHPKAQLSRSSISRRGYTGKKDNGKGIDFLKKKQIS